MQSDPGPQEFLDIARAAMHALPDPIGDLAGQVTVSVIDLPPTDVLNALGIKDPLALTGLYDGIPLTEKSFGDQPEAPDMIWLYRQPILAEWRQRGNVEIADLVAHVLVHEFAHHFGWSDADIAAIDRWWE